MSTVKACKAPEQQVASFINEGIPVSMAVFRSTVRAMTGTKGPEFAFYDTPGDANVIPSRRAKMWLTPLGLLCEQEGKYKVVPSANLVDVNLK